MANFGRSETLKPELTKTDAPVPPVAPKSDVPPVAPTAPVDQFEDFDEVPALVKDNKYQEKINELARTGKASMTLIEEKNEKNERDLVRKAANAISKGGRTRISKKHPKTGAAAPAGKEYMVFWLETMTKRPRKSENE
jgi:hypothetical protein